MQHAGENEYRQKAFLSATRKWCCRYPGGFQRRAGRPAFGTRFCPAKSSVLYLLRPLTAERDCHSGPLQNRRFCGERRSSGVSEICRLRRSKRYGACDDEAGRFRWQQNSVFAMPPKLQKWSVRAKAIRRDFIRRGNEAGSPRAQKGYKTRRSDASPFSQYHHGSSSHTLSKASASVDFALLSER